MSINLRMTDSYHRCNSSTRRHLRMCGKVKGAGVLAAAIKDKHERLKAKKAELDAAEEESEDALDSAVFQDGELDNGVRDFAGRTKEFDRKTPGSNLIAKFFPDGVNDVIYTNREDEPDDVDQIATLIESLGSDHELFPFAAKLREEAQKSRDANNAYIESVKKVNNLKTELDIVKSVLITQYANNILDAQKLFGKDFANRLFPKIGSAGSGKDDPPDNVTGGGNNGSTEMAEVK